MENIADYLMTLKDVASALAQLPKERKPLIEKAVEKFVATSNGRRSKLSSTKLEVVAIDRTKDKDLRKSRRKRRIGAKSLGYGRLHLPRSCKQARPRFLWEISRRRREKFQVWTKYESETIFEESESGEYRRPL